MRNKLIKRDILKHIGYIPNTYRLPDWKVAMSNEQFRSFSDHGKPSPLSGELLKNSSLPQHFFFCIYVVENNCLMFHNYLPN